LEISNNDRINFLDVTIIIDSHIIVFDCYKKPTFSGRYVNFHSQHPLFQEKSNIYGLVDRILFLSHPNFHEKNLEKAINVLLDNCFPLPFISFFHSTINKRIKQLLYRKNNSNKEDNKLKNRFFSQFHVSNISESFLPVCKKFEFNMSHSILNTLKRYIKRGKDDLEILSHHVIYKIT